MADNLFEQAGTPAPETPDAEVDNFLDKYVGEGKKYKSVEELAKAKAHADKHIDTLTGELSGLREFMTAQFEQLGKRSVETPTTQTDADKGQLTPDPVTPPNGGGNEDDLNARIAKALEERDESKRLQANADLTQEAMVKHYGDQAAAVKAIQEKAAELGVNAQFLADTAFRSPKAFFNIMGINPEETPRSTSTPNSSSDVNPRTLDKVNPGVKPGTYAYFDQLRKTDPRKYWLPETQTALMKAAKENPDFFKR